MRDDSTTEHDDVIQAGLDELLAHLGEKVGVSARQRGKAQKASVFITHGVNDLLRRPSQAGVNHLMARITQQPGFIAGRDILAAQLLVAAMNHKDFQRTAPPAHPDFY